jgi:parallel beta-helix repeat protein
MKCRTICLLLGIPLLLCIPALAADYVIQVGPPVGTDNTDQVQGALNECVNLHPGGCTVQLSAGTYLTSQLFAKDFHGTFKGKGMDVTIIQALPALDVSTEIPVWNSPPSLDNKYPMLILFFGGDITVSDMTIRDLEINPTKGWHDYQGHVDFWIWHQDPNTWLWSVLEFMGESAMNVVVTRVALQGASDESVPGLDIYNAAGLSIDPYPPIDSPAPGYLAGTFLVSACRIDTLQQGIYAAVLHDAQLTIGGSPSAANLIQNCGYDATLIDLDSSSVDFSYNDVSAVGPTAFAGFMVAQYVVVPIEVPSSFLVQHNRLKATGADEDAIWVADLAPWYGEPKTGNFVISNNDITIMPTEDRIAGDGIETYQTEGSIISNNRIVGSGWTGIAIWEDTRAMIKANNVQNVVAGFFYPAPISLMDMTNNCTVVGFGSKTNVYDEGVNNTLIGVNRVQGNAPLGPAIRDAMERKREMIKSMRKP